MTPVIESFSAASAVKKLLDMACNLTTERVSLLLGVDKEIKKLIKDLNLISRNLEEVEKQQTTHEACQKWLRDLKDLAYDGEDVVDEFATEVGINPTVACSSDTVPETGMCARLFGAKLVSAFSRLKRLIICCICCCGGTGTASPVSVRLDIADKIKEIQNKLDDLLARKKRLNLSIIVPSPPARPDSDQHRSLRPPVGPSSDFQFEMVGRETEKNELINQLIGTNTVGSTSGQSCKLPVITEVQKEKNVSIISIVGMGGAGKSTLAQQVYQEVKRQFTFDKWLSVGESFNPKFLIAKLLEETINQDAQLCDLQEKLRGKVKGQRFLIVLDDVWNTSHSMWAQLWMPLTYGSKGSRVLITCRDKKVVQATGFKPTIELQPLKDDDCLSVFLRHAFPKGDSNKYPDLKCVAEKIVSKLKGLPLAAKVVGSSLFGNLDPQKWNSILEDELWVNVEEGEDSVMNHLKWSYNLLPPHLKQCFGYCSIYPKDHNFDIQHDLVLKWMAAGLIQPQGRRRPEDIGIEYFEDLLQKSFFDRINKRYVMHDLIHDLAELVSSHECACYERLKTEDTATSSVRHLSLDKFPAAGSPYNFQKVRTVLYTGLERVPDGFFNRLKYIRVLDLRIGHTLDNIHAEHISRLKHLRYLRCGIEFPIPKSFGELYNLQVLVVTFNRFPAMNDSLFYPIKGISDLSKLRHIYPTYATSWIESVGRLTTLQSLPYFNVRKMAGFGIEELQCLAQLRGRLHISGLENVETKEEAKKSSLVDKQHLTELELYWKRTGQTVSRSEQNKILEALQPNPNLQKLTISGYGGEQLPRWLADASSLRSLKLLECEELLFNDDNLFGNLIQLRHLEIVWCPQFSNGLCGLITWRVEQNASVSFVLPNLESLTINDTRLFSTFLGSGDKFCNASSVKEIVLSDIEGNAGLRLWNENMQTEQLSRFTSLKVLRFRYLKCNDLPSYLYLLPSLEKLQILFCDQILELPKHGLPKSLQVLSIQGCEQLVLRCIEGGPEWEKIKFIPKLIKDFDITAWEGIRW